jgi:hypothetical protein
MLYEQYRPSLNRIRPISPRNPRRQEYLDAAWRFEDNDAVGEQMDRKPRKKHIKYSEGQWFAVPLKDGGYALGVIVRGSYKTKGGLGYFFGPRYESVPDEQETWTKQPSDAVLIAWFSDLGITRGKWQLIPSTCLFRREEWPIPTFKRLDALKPEKGWLVEYSQDTDDVPIPVRERYCNAMELLDIPDDGDYGYEAVEIVLTKRLAEG